MLKWDAVDPIIELQIKREFSKIRVFCNYALNFKWYYTYPLRFGNIHLPHAFLMLSVSRWSKLQPTTLNLVWFIIIAKNLEIYNFSRLLFPSSSLYFHSPPPPLWPIHLCPSSPPYATSPSTPIPFPPTLLLVLLRLSTATLGYYIGTCLDQGH